MIRVLKKNFSKEVKQQLKKHKSYFCNTTIHYTIDNGNDSGTITIKSYDTNDVATEISSPIKLTNKIHSRLKPVYKIDFGVKSTDSVFDIITKDHYIEVWQNAYRNQIQIIENGKANDCLYHISMIDFYDEKRNKSTRLQDICFDGYEIIKTLN